MGGHELALWEVFDTVARAVPERTAIVAGSTRRSYGAVLDRATRLGRFLTAAGLGCTVARSDLQPWESGQDFVALYMLNGPEYLEASLASYAARVVPANVNYRYVRDELAHVLLDCRARAVIFHRRFAPMLAEVLPQLEHRPLLIQVDDGSVGEGIAGALDYEQVIAGSGTGDVMPIGGPVTPDDLYVVYTGGTTGLPKGTLWRQADLYVAALGGDSHSCSLSELSERARAREPVVMLPIAPFMHGAAHWAALRGLLAGDSVVVNSVVDRLDADDVWTLVEKERVGYMLLIGEAFARPLLDQLGVQAYDLTSVRIVVVGGAATTPTTKERLMAALPNAVVADVAGASETGSLLSAVSSRGAATEPGVFKAGPTTVVLDADRSSILRPGDQAEGWVAKRGHIPLGYLGDIEKTKATFPTIGGTRYVVPGDRARHRSDGTIALLGREAVTINSGGEKIFAAEVEAALLGLPEVHDAIVVGRRSERWGQEVVAVVALRSPDVSDEELIDRLHGIARYKRPKAIYRVDRVQRSAAGKADYSWATSLVERGETL